MPRVSATGAAIATAVAGLFALGVSALIPDAARDEATVQCAGANACSGEAGCGTATNACQSPNACSSDAVLELSREECERRGGTVAAG